MDQRRIMIFIENPTDLVQVEKSMTYYVIDRNLKNLKVEAYSGLGRAESGIGHGGEILVIFGEEYKGIEKVDVSKFSGEKKLRLSVFQNAFVGSKNLCEKLGIPYMFYGGQLRAWDKKGFYSEVDKALEPKPKTLESILPKESR